MSDPLDPNVAAENFKKLTEQLCELLDGMPHPHRCIPRIRVKPDSLDNIDNVTANAGAKIVELAKTIGLEVEFKGDQVTITGETGMKPRRKLAALNELLDKEIDSAIIKHVVEQLDNRFGKDTPKRVDAVDQIIKATNPSGGLPYFTRTHTAVALLRKLASAKSAPTTTLPSN